MKLSMKYININCVHTFIEARRLFAITYVLKIQISVFRPNPQNIVKLSKCKFEIVDLSRISAFMKYIAYWGILKPKYWSIFT